MSLLGILAHLTPEEVPPPREATVQLPAGLAVALPANDNAEARGLKVPQREHAANDQQWAYVCSTARRCAVCCSRRAGKTSAAVLKAARILSLARKWGHYVSLLRRNALTQFFHPLIEFLEQALGWVRDEDFWVNETNMLVTTAWGSNVKAFSCPTMAEVSSCKGDRSDWFCIDECQEPNDDVVTALIRVAATPMTTDSGGSIDLLGTPPHAEPCHFSEALDNERWQRHWWTQFDHDMPRSREEKWEDAKKSFAEDGLHFTVTESVNDNGRLVLEVDPHPDKTHPIVCLEYFGLRVKDPRKLAYEYQRGRNDYDPATLNLAKLPSYRIGWGIDIGYSDADAIVVTALDFETRRLYVLWQWRRNHRDVFDLADFVKVLREVLPPHHEAVTGDHGGHGATKTLKSLETVLGLPIAAKPQDVMVSVGMVNDDLRAARLVLPTQDVYTSLLVMAAYEVYAHDPKRLCVVLAMLGQQVAIQMAAEHFADDPARRADIFELVNAPPADLASELGLVQKSVNPRTKKIEVNKKGFHSDLSEALRYCHSGLLRAPAPPAEAKPSTDPEAIREAEIDAYCEAIQEAQNGDGR